ncbi:hypothetical protein ABG067_007743, partial [Albugo candida]
MQTAKTWKRNRRDINPPSEHSTHSQENCAISQHSHDEEPARSRPRHQLLLSNTPFDAYYEPEFGGSNDDVDPVAIEIATQKCSWNQVLPTLVEPYLDFVGRAGIPLPIPHKKCTDCDIIRTDLRCKKGCTPIEFVCNNGCALTEFREMKFYELHVIRDNGAISGEGLANIYNALVSGCSSNNLLNAGVCRNIIYYHSKLMLLVEKRLRDETEAALTSFECPACPKVGYSNLTANNMQIINGDGNFNHKCKFGPDLLEENLVTEEEEEVWVSPESVKKFEKNQISKEDLNGENHHRAAGHRENVKSRMYPITGIFGAACARHGTIHKVVDMETGEGSKYILAVLHEMFGGQSPIGRPKTGVMYDIVCVVKNSLKKHFPQFMGEPGHREEDAWVLAVPVFHAFAHVMHCQAAFNPAYTNVVGNVDGEGMERFWSDMASLIRMTRNMSHANRRMVWTKAMLFFNKKKKNIMGEFLGKRFQTTTNALVEANWALESPLVSESSLEDTWSDFLQRMLARSSSGSNWFDIPEELELKVKYHFLAAYEKFFTEQQLSEERFEGRTYFTSGVKAIQEEKDAILKLVLEADSDFDPTPVDLSAAVFTAEELRQLKKRIVVGCVKMLMVLYKKMDKKQKEGRIGN